MSYFTRDKLRRPINFVVGVGIFALLAAWAMYRNNPAGLLQHADGNPCPSVVHSFSTTYLAIIGTAAAFALVVGIVCVVVRDLGLVARLRPNLHALARSCALSIGGLILISLIAIPLKATMPLAPGEPCQAPRERH